MRPVNLPLPAAAIGLDATSSRAAASPAFDDLYARFGPSIYARCRQILRDSAAAEDATQEVFFRIHPRLGTIAGPREALAWLYKTATHHCLNEVRNGRTRALLASA